MPPTAFDHLTRHAAQALPLSRRASLLALAASGLATLTAPALAEAKGKGKKQGRKRKKAKKKLKKLAAEQCQGQVGKCFDFAAAFCPGTFDPAQCQANADRCCATLSQCIITDFLGCLAQPT